MNKFLVCLFSLVAVATAHADHKPGHTGGFSMSGSLEGGLSVGFGGSAAGGVDWLVDNVEMQNGYTISDKTKVTVNHGFSAMSATPTGSAGHAQDSVRFFSPATIAAGGLAYEVREAYVTHQCADKFTTSVGMFRNIFGMENMWDRYDMANYYYSRAYQTWQGLGWNYNLGVKFDIHGLEATLFQSANSATDTRTTPGVAARYKFDISGGDWTLTPVVSAYFGRWYGAPKDIGFSAGAMWKMGTLWANLEFEYGQQKTTANVTSSKDWSIIAEPGFDLGFASLSAKWEFTSNTAGTTDMNLSAGLTKSYDKLRTRLLYTHNNLGGKLGAHANEVRMLFGAEW
jgi:hypothetical protein